MTDLDIRQLRAEVDKLREELRARWDRDLPMHELFDDRWERARRLGFGEGSSIYADSYVYGDVQVGSGTWIGPYTLLDGTGGLRIGDHCDISAGVQVYTHDTVRRVLSEGRSPIHNSPVTIGDYCHVGAGAIIARGISIGHHSVIGAGAFVNRDIPEHSIAVGIPCRVVGSVVVDSNGEVLLRYDRPPRG